jgi:glucose/mannose-6-phosphate isomerase
VLLNQFKHEKIMMRNLIESFPQQLQAALQAGEQITVKSQAPITHVVVAGMGGSGIGGVIANALIYNELKVPYTTVATYDIPASVNENTLFIGCSFSGNTEETISALHQAIKAKAQIHLVTSGGEFAKIAAEHNLAVAPIPGESKSPRANLGYSLLQVMYILHKHGLIGGQFATDFAQLADELIASSAAIQEEATALAAAMKGKLPIIYSDQMVNGVAVRFQQQINENSKQLVHVNAFPEMNHNELVGWEYPEVILKNSVVVRLITDYDHAQVSRRFEICERFFNEQSSVVHVKAQGSSLLKQLFYLVHLTDWSTLFLAEMNGVDAYPVKKIDFLKAELSK